MNRKLENITCDTELRVSRKVRMRKNVQIIREGSASVSKRNTHLSLQPIPRVFLKLKMPSHKLKIEQISLTLLDHNAILDNCDWICVDNGW